MTRGDSPAGGPLGSSTVRCLCLVLLGISVILLSSSADAAASKKLLTPIPGDAALNHTLFWGTYRPNVYFGVRARSPSSPLFGLMWMGIDDFQSQNHLRHACEQGDLERYGWVKHDGVSFGKQELVDGLNNVLLKTWLVKRAYDESNDGEWSARITGEKKTAGIEKGVVSLYFYVALPQEIDGSTLQLVGTHPKKGLTGDSIQIDGSTPELGGFSIVIKSAKSNKAPRRPSESVKLRTPLSDLQKIHFLGLRLPPSDVWNVKAAVERITQAERRSTHMEYMNAVAKKRGQSSASTPIPSPSPLTYAPTLPNTIDKGANVLVFQFTFSAPFELDIAYLSHALHPSLSPSSSSAPKKGGTAKAAKGSPAVSVKDLESLGVAGDALTEVINQREGEFERRFEAAFGLAKKGFSSAQQKFAMAAFSNLVGGIGFFSGSGIVKHPLTGDMDFTPPQTLYSGVPSRSFFPRGFLWDEGFHNLLINPFDQTIPREVQRHWFNLMDPATGWIAREQILGEEARSRVPEQFQPQSDNIANPPTFLFLLHNITLRSLAAKQRQQQQQSPQAGEQVDPHDTGSFVSAPAEDGDLARDLAYLTNAYPHVERNYQWFMSSQSGAEPNSFRWRGRTVNHTFASGLDDYPRAIEPSDSEQHLDLLCWMATYAKVMADLSLLLGKDSATYSNTHQALLARIESVHWNEATSSYSDVASFVRGTSTYNHSPHIGYISLWPILLGHVDPTNPHFLSTLEHVRDANHLWSPNGLRSLSVSDPMYGTGENYWKGPVWMNVNYMLLAALKKHYLQPDRNYQGKVKAQEIYDQLRDNLVRNMYRVYQQTGYLWENYHGMNGNGQGCRPFTGWSALVVLVMAELYP